MPDNGKVWIVGRSFWEVLYGHLHWTWDFHGVFHKKKDAVALCRDQHWFIVPVIVNQPFPSDPHEFSELEVPNKTKADPLIWRRRKNGLAE